MSVADDKRNRRSAVLSALSAGSGALARHRDLVIDVGLAIAVFIVIAVAITADLGGERRPDIVAYLFAAGLGALMLVRRQHPGLTLAATAVGIVTYYAFGYPAIGLAIPVAAALYSAAEAGLLIPAIATGVGLFAFSIPFRVMEGQSLAFLLGYELAANLGLMGAMIAVGDGVRARRMWRDEAAERIRQVAEAEQREAARRLEAERLRLARELHDTLAHTLSVVSLHTDVAAETLRDDPGTAQESLRTIRAATSDAMRELRTTVEYLRTPAEEAERAPVGGLAQLDRLVEATRASGLATSVSIEGEPVPLPSVIDATAYRIVQESLTNALRHADADTVSVVVTYQPDQLRITVTDDGRGGEVTGNGHGLAGMAERAGLLGGTLRAGPRRDGGFEVDATIPLQARS